MSDTGHAEIGDPMSNDPYIDLDKWRGTRPCGIAACKALSGRRWNQQQWFGRTTDPRPHNRPSAAQQRVKNTGRGRITSSYCEPTAR